MLPSRVDSLPYPQTRKVRQGQTLQLIWPICKIQPRKFYSIGPRMPSHLIRCQFHKHFLCVTYDCSKISLHILKQCIGTSFHLTDSAAYLARVVSYAREMFMKLATDVLCDYTLSLFCSLFSSGSGVLQNGPIFLTKQSVFMSYHFLRRR